MDPWKPLLSAAERAAHTQAERWQHPAERPAVPVQRHAQSNYDDAQPVLPGALRFRFPVPAEIGKEIGARPGRFRQLLLAAISVVADGRRADERLRARRRPPDRIDEPACARDPALADLLLLRGVPSAGHRLAHQVYNGVHRRELSQSTLPGDGLETWEDRLRALRVAREGNDDVTAARKLRAESSADESRGARDRDSHG